MGSMLQLTIELIGVGVFALTGALVAARKGMDPFGFALLATVTGIGGGSVRDVLLGQPAFWTAEPTQPLICVGVGMAAYLLGSRVRGLMGQGRPYRVLLWADAVGLAMFCVGGAQKALSLGAPAITAIVMGTLTASFGGIIRDLLAGDVPLVLHKEIYVTAALLGALVCVVAEVLGLPHAVASLAGISAAFSLRGLAIARDWSLPPFRPLD